MRHPVARIHQVQSPQKDGVDDVTGEPLIQRDDDKEETRAQGLEVYQRQTRPLVEYYSAWAARGATRRRPGYRRIGGTGSVDEIRARALAALAAETHDERQGPMDIAGKVFIVTGGGIGARRRHGADAGFETAARSSLPICKPNAEPRSRKRSAASSSNATSARKADAPRRVAAASAAGQAEWGWSTAPASRPP